MPQELREAVSRILTPAYRRFVLDAPAELERSIGLTLVHLMWLELCGQLQVAIAVADPNSVAAILQNPEDMIDRHLHLVTTKCQTAELLMKLRVMSEMFDRQPAAASLPSPANLALPTLNSPLIAQTACGFAEVARQPTEAEIGKPQSC